MSAKIKRRKYLSDDKSREKTSADFIRQKVNRIAMELEQNRHGSYIGKKLETPKSESRGWREACIKLLLPFLHAMLMYRKNYPKKFEKFYQAENFQGLIQDWEKLAKKTIWKTHLVSALDLLKILEKRKILNFVFLKLAKAVQEFGDRLYADGWDSFGPLYHESFRNIQGDGAFYTNNVSALLLTRLTLDGALDHVDWTDPDSITQLKVMDPSCGSGALLMAVIQEFKRRAKEANPDLDLEDLHGKLLENSICGIDINPEALKLAAFNLSLGAKKVNNKIHLYLMERDVTAKGPRIGALEILRTKRREETFSSIFSVEKSLYSLGARKILDPDSKTDFFPCENLDLVLMNPPFTNATNRASQLPPETRRLLQIREKEIGSDFEFRNPDLKDITNYNSIGTYFSPLAEMLLDPDKGLFGLLWPTVACTGRIGIEERNLFSRKFHLARVISNHDAKRPAFSDGSTIEECLLAFKRAPAKGKKKPTDYVSLRKKPKNAAEVSKIMRSLKKKKTSPEWFTFNQIPEKRINSGLWRFVQWHQPELDEVAQFLETHPALTLLRKVGDLGPASGQTLDEWEKCPEEEKELNIFYSKSNKIRTKIQDFPEQPVKYKKQKRNEWSRATKSRSNLLISVGNSAVSVRTLALYSKEECFGVGWVPVVLDNPEDEFAAAGWLNSIPARIIYYNRRARSLHYPLISDFMLKRLKVPKDFSPLEKHTRRCLRKKIQVTRKLYKCPVTEELNKGAAKILGVEKKELDRWTLLLSQEPSLSRRYLGRNHYLK